MDHPEPAWTTPAPMPETPSSICVSGTPPYIITGMLLRFLESRFSDPDRILDPALKTLIWREKTADSAETGILIEPGHRYDPRNADQRPALYVLRGAVSNAKVGMGVKNAQPDPQGNFRGPRHISMLAGTHVVKAVSSSAMATERLANEVFFALVDYAPALREEYKMSFLQCAGLSELRQREGSKDHFEADISVQWQNGHGWTMAEAAPLFARMRIVDPGNGLEY